MSFWSFFFYLVLVVILVVPHAGHCGKFNIGRSNLSYDEIGLFVGNLIRDHNMRSGEKFSINDVALIRSMKDRNHILVEKVVQNIPRENPVLMPKLGEKVISQRIRTVAFTIIIADHFNMKKLFLQLQPLEESDFWKNTEKFIFITTRSASSQKIFSTFELFYGYRTLNAITIVLHGKYFKVFSYNPHLQGDMPMYEIGNTITDTTKVFEDKMKNLHGYSYKLVEYLEPLKFRSQNEMFMQEMCRAQNASFTVQSTLTNRNKNFLHDYKNLMITKKVDMTLNTGVKTTFNYKPLPSVITYDEKAYCAMIPKPPPTPFIELILKPFDGWTWIFFGICVASCAVVWRLYRFFYPNTGDSTWYFLFGIFIHFIGQSISFRGNRTKQVLLLQLCIMMTFILGNCYQSSLITFMTESRYGTRLKTIDELMKSDFNFKVDPVFYDIIKASNDFPSIEKNMEEIELTTNEFHYLELAKSKTVLIMRCDLVEMFYYNINLTEGPTNHYYIMPQKFYKSLTSFELSDDSPYQSYLQHYSDLVFESGIKSYWQNFIIKFKDYRAEMEQRYIQNEEFYLKMADLKPVFVIWMICLVGCFVALLLEIFWHDYLQHFTWAMACKAYWEAIKKMVNRKPKKQKLRVRFIQVQPAREIDTII